MKKYLFSLVLAAILTGCGESGAGSSSGDSSSSGSQSTGKGGSMARFAVSGDYLYTINKREMEIFYLGDPSAPQPDSKVHVPFDVETLFDFKGYLYVGSESGVYIYDKSTPSNPTQVAKFTHTRSCDPVVVSNNDLAFITLNKGSTCRLNSGENTLQVLDIKDPLNPKLIKTVGMWDPKGLGITDDNQTLFVCDGNAGLKVFGVKKYEHNETNQTRVDIISQPTNNIADVNCYDVIAYHQKYDDKNDTFNLIVSDGDRVRQFDYSKFPMQEWGEIK